VNKISNKWLPGYIALGVTWGCSFLLIKYSLLSLSPVGVAFFRGFFGALVLLIILLITKQKLPNKLNHWLHLSVVAFLLNSAPGFLFAYSETLVSSALAGMHNATTPIMSVLFTFIIFREQKITGNQLLGILVGFGGVGLLSSFWNQVDGTHWTGIFALLLATSCYGISYPYSKRYLSKLEFSSISLATAQVMCSVVMLSPFLFFSKIQTATFTLQSTLAILALGGIGSGVAYIWNFETVRLAGASIASSVTYLTPVFAVIVGFIFLSEKLNTLQMVGGLLVLISAAMIQNRIKVIR
jgi:drug/metabolite transporter (DMT)-like permease